MKSSKKSSRLKQVSEASLELRSLSDLMATYAKRWPIFLLAISTALLLAYLYLKITPKIYQIEATLLIQDSKKVPEEKLALQELELTSTSKLVENEIALLTSHQFIEQCVRDLGLNVRYKELSHVVNHEIFTDRPVNFTLLRDQVGTTYQLNLQIMDGQHFDLSVANAPAKRYQFNQVYENQWGRWKVTPTHNLPAWVGKTLGVELSEHAKTANYYQKAIEASLINKQSPVVKLAINDAMSERGENVLNHLISIYNGAAEAVKSKLTKNTLQFLDERLKTLGQELNYSEKEISGFRSTKGLTDVASQSKIYLENAQSNQQQLNEVDIQLNIVEGLGKYLDSHNNVQLAPATLGITDPTLASLIEKLSVLQIQREKLLAVTPESSPAFEPIDRQIVSTRAAIGSTVTNFKGALIRTRNKLLDYSTRNDQSLHNIPQQERELTGIKRQQSIKENLYLYLLQKREEFSLSYASTLTDARVVDKAYPVQVMWPKQSLVYTLALLLGLVLPVAGIYLLEHTYTKVQSGKEVEAAIAGPVLGKITLSDGHDLLAAGDLSNQYLFEQLRRFRVHLNTIYKQTSTGRVTLLTSSVAGEGKSYLARNLAYVLASTGRKTVLVEFDMRRPSLAKAWGLRQEQCTLENYFHDHVPTSQLVVNSGKHELLDVVACQKSIRNAAELLEQPAVDALIDYLRLIYDDIIIDTPPTQLVADASILARITDVCLYLVRQRVTPKNALPELRELQQAGLFKKMYVVLNAATLDETRLKHYQYYTANEA